MKKFAIVVIIAKFDNLQIIPTSIGSQLYIATSPDKEIALSFVLGHSDIKQLLSEGYFILRTNIAEI